MRITRAMRGVRMSPWFQDRGGFDARFHPKECIAVARYPYDRVPSRAAAPDVAMQDCLLCDLNIIPAIERFGPVARRVADHIPSPDGSLGQEFDPLRTIDTVTEDPLQAAGYLEDNRGAETVRWIDWRARRKEAADTPKFMWLLRDCIECHLVFYREFGGYEDDEAFLEAEGLDCPDNIADTWEWLQDFDIPEELSHEQAGLEAFAYG